MEYFDEELPYEEKKIKCLLWCDRHCCLCDKSCDINIEVHHIDKNDKNNLFDNLMPLCLDCHAKIKGYDPKHPIGTKYKEKEIKARRNQIYEKYTSNLVPVVILGFKQDKHQLPTVEFYLRHVSQGNAVKVFIKLQIELGKSNISDKFKELRGLFTGKKSLNLNPGYGYDGHFNLPKEAGDSNEVIRIIPTIIIIDKFDYPHKLLPNAHKYIHEMNRWDLVPL